MFTSLLLSLIAPSKKIDRRQKLSLALHVFFLSTLYDSFEEKRIELEGAEWGLAPAEMPNILAVYDEKAAKRGWVELFALYSRTLM